MEWSRVFDIYYFPSNTFVDFDRFDWDNTKLYSANNKTDLQNINIE